MRRTLVLSIFGLIAAVTSAQAAPATIEGPWRGSGVVTYQGKSDPLECRVRYTRGTDKSYAVTSLCATESCHYELSGCVFSVGSNHYRGWCTAKRAKRKAGRSSCSTAIAFPSPSRIPKAPPGSAFHGARLWSFVGNGRTSRKREPSQANDVNHSPTPCGGSECAENFDRYGVHAVTSKFLLGYSEVCATIFLPISSILGPHCGKAVILLCYDLLTT
jgi:hypothetical protein